MTDEVMSHKPKRKARKNDSRKWRRKKLNICGKEYTVKYIRMAQNMDVAGAEAIWGTVDHFRKIIRVYDSEYCQGDTFDTLIHEILHAIAIELNIEILTGDTGERAIGPLATALADTLVRNKILGT